MLRVPQNITAPATITLIFQNPVFGADLTAITSGLLNVTRRDGSTAVWALTIVSQTPNELVAQYQFAGGELNTTGVYYLAPVFTLPGGSIPAQTIALFVTSPNSLNPQLEETGWVAATASFPGGPPLGIIRKKTATILFSQLTSTDTSGAPFTLPFDTAFAKDALLLGFRVAVNSLFTGGGVALVILDVGGSPAPQSFGYSTMSISAGATGTQPMSASYATGAIPMVAVAGTTMTAQFVCDQGHSLSELTAGSVTIDTYYLEAF